MKIVFKHILKNIWEKKVRSLLIILALTIATSVFVLNLTLPDEIILKIQETMRSVYGKTDVFVSTVEPFSPDELNMGDEEIKYISSIQSQVSINDKQVLIYGVDVEKTKEMDMLGDDVPVLNENEVIINEKQAKDNGYKEGDTLAFEVEGEKYEFKIVKVVEPKGMTALDVEFPVFIASEETVDKIYASGDGMVDCIYIDVVNDDNVKDFIEYLKENNENYIVEEMVNVESIQESVSLISYIMIIIFAMATIMIFFVVSSLNKIIIAERMPVIGTFRSVGAAKGKMNFILILENAVYGLIGGIIGVFAGYGINSKAASLFISTNGVELSGETSKMSGVMILIGISFAVLLEVFISLQAILKANKKPVKDIIFDVQSTRYRIKKSRVISGVIMIGAAVTFDVMNKSEELLFTVIALVLMIIGIANLVPLLIRLVSLAFTWIFKKIGYGAGIIAGKNIGYNKMIISSSRLIVISLSLMLAILTVSSSFTKLFKSFEIVAEGSDIVVYNIEKTEEEYNELLKSEDIESARYSYYIGDNETTYNDGKSFYTTPIMLGLDEADNTIKELDYKIADLKYDEALIDEKIAEKNDIKVNDTITIEFGTLNKTVTLKVVGLVNSAYFTTSRNVIVMNLENFKENLMEEPTQIWIKAKSGADLQELKKDIEKDVKEVGVTIQTVEEFIKEQEEGVSSTMSIFYVVIGLAGALSFIGIINNQVIGFIQRRKELAILNSTCMSRGQLNRMLRTEIILANSISCLLAIGISFILTGITDTFMKGLSLYVDMEFDIILALEFVGIVFVILLFTTIIPARRLKKMNIVDEIKYE